MIIAAVDVSGSINDVKGYQSKVYDILSSLKPPIRLIQWNSVVASDTTHNAIDKSIAIFRGSQGTKPECFFRVLPSRTPIELHIVTDGQMYDYSVKQCRFIVKSKDIQVSQVHLYYIGRENDMNLKFTDVFEGIPQSIHINEEYIGSVAPEIDFNTIHYIDIMKDDSFKATILKLVNSDKTDKATLKRKINSLTTRILQEHFTKEKLTISSFYAQRDVEGCIKYVKTHSYYTSKVDFQKKMSDILTLFDNKTNTYSLKCFTETPKITLTCQSDDETNDKAKEDTDNDKAMDTTESKENPLDCAYLTCDILFEKCQLACIPVKQCKDDVWPDKKTLQNPFKLLESDFLIERIVHLVEPFVMDYKKCYQTLKKHTPGSDIPGEVDISSPFTRDPLQGVYILHNDHIDVQAMIKHNNYVLSTFFQNTLPGKPVLWHMIFLYIVAMKRFPDKKQILFEEIRFLGQHDTYFITLSPFLNPPIVDPLNCCFWYIAHVCPKAFPNSKKNVLRNDFVSGVFLEFYRNVYEENYIYPTKMPVWQLWNTLFYDKMSIFSILSHYYQHEEIQNVTSVFNTILYRNMKQPPETPPKPFHFLSQLSLKTVLDIYKMRLENQNLNANLEVIKEQNVSLYDENDDKEEDLLSHVKINPKTCRPYITCPITQKYWRDCIGKYNQKTHSYVRLFNRYCQKYDKYPQSGDDLLCFLNEYIYQHKGQIPEVFPIAVKRQMNQVMDIFKEVMKRPCHKYLIIADHLSSEKDRKKLESD